MRLSSATFATALLGASCLVYAQSTASNSTSAASTTPAASATSTSVPFFTIPNTFTPPASGESPVPGSVITISNGPYLSDTFSYTAALSTVQPTGNITRSDLPASQGGGGGTTNLQPDPTNLQTAGARRNSQIGGDLTTVLTGSALFSFVLVGLMTGIGLVAAF
ncbi:hypothetical protein JCM3766R1_006066 [Sporobolomyces carnicolor]